MWFNGNDGTGLVTAIQRAVVEQVALVVLVANSDSECEREVRTIDAATSSSSEPQPHPQVNPRAVLLRLTRGSTALAQLDAVFQPPPPLPLDQHQQSLEDQPQPEVYTILAGVRRRVPFAALSDPRQFATFLGSVSVLLQNLQTQTQTPASSTVDNAITSGTTSGTTIGTATTTTDITFVPASVPPTNDDTPADTPASTPTVKSDSFDTSIISLKFSHDSLVVKSTFNASDTLSSIRAFIVRSGFIAPFQLVQPYPMKVYDVVEESLTLTDLGLVPTGSLVVRKIIENPKKKLESAKKAKQIIPEVVKPIYDSAALSIRLPDGSNIRTKFASSDTFGIVRAHISSHLKENNNFAFDVSQLYPARVFGIMDENRSLKDLDLVPSASLIVKIAVNQSTAFNGTTGGSISSLAFAPFKLLIAWIGIFIAWLSLQARRFTATAPYPPAVAVAASSGDAVINGTVKTPAHSTNRARNLKTLADLRKEEEEKEEGGDEDDDQTKKKKKDNLTYNGNSTAQDF
ncbi:hypothetical protein HK100_004279 [Physocladia obscura]|uniref:UBX domain-containing protein n=1 Tax=Physocladia obscura TaxID=109957 RepID=A0AAD5XCQ1_9FUNG|nr:hypothetical protein HK100_004279 [Physocladia obscura]